MPKSKTTVPYTYAHGHQQIRAFVLSEIGTTEEVNKKIDEIIKRTKKLDMNESLMELKVLLEYFETLYNDFDKEKYCRKNYRL